MLFFLVPFAPNSPFTQNDGSQPKVIARASTLKLINRSDQIGRLASDDPHAIPKGSHWADEAEGDTILIIDQPSTQFCAAVGGIMAARMKAKGLHGCVVSGRVRDLAELKSSGLPVSACPRVSNHPLTFQIDKTSTMPADLPFKP